jgi:hypothetical protein
MPRLATLPLGGHEELTATDGGRAVAAARGGTGREVERRWRDGGEGRERREEVVARGSTPCTARRLEITRSLHT